MIWNFIRDFLVQYIFGGTTSDGSLFGGYLFTDGVNSYEQDTANTFFKTLFVDDGDSPLYISIGDWLSSTTTIIIMCVIVFLFALLVRFIFKAVMSAFLLK